MTLKESNSIQFAGRRYGSVFLTAAFYLIAGFLLGYWAAS